MRARCNRPTHNLYKWYGGRGITVCPEWASFTEFYLAMYPSYKEGLQLDRIDNQKGYSPDNCRWVTPKQNNRNRSSNRLINTPDGVMVLAKAAEMYGLDQKVITYRIKRGYPSEKVFSKIDYRSVV